MGSVRKHRLRVWLAIVFAAALALILSACGEAETKATINVVDAQFESEWINNAIAEYVIEKGYGYPVETVQVSTVVGQASLAKGDVDLNMELWQQNNLEWYKKETAAGNIINLGRTYEGGPQFWIVPKWAAEQYNIRTVEDLKRPEVVKLFPDPEDPKKGSFINCILGWNCESVNRAKFKAYGLDGYYNIVSPGSAAAMDAALAGPQKKRQPVFGYYWAPTSMMGKYDWAVIQEPPFTDQCWAEVLKGSADRNYTPKEACAYQTLPVEKGMHKDLLKKAPDVVEMLKKMDVGLEPLNKTAAWGVENDIKGDWEKAAVYYLKSFESRWKTWMPDANYKKVKEALAQQP